MIAYLDPASGSIIVQGLVAGAAGAAVVGKVGWRKISSPFRRGSTPSDDEVGPAVDEEHAPTSGE